MMAQGFFGGRSVPCHSQCCAPQHIIWIGLFSLFFFCCEYMLQCSEVVQWLVLKQDGYVSFEMATASWGTLPFLHPSQCIWISNTSFQPFHMRIYFQRRTAQAHIEFTVKNRYALLWGGLRPAGQFLCPDLQRKGNIYVKLIHPYPDSQLAIFTIQAVNASVSPEQSNPPGFPRLKPWMKMWKHPFSIDMAPPFPSRGSCFFLPKSKLFCDWHLPWFAGHCRGGGC